MPSPNFSFSSFSLAPPATVSPDGVQAPNGFNFDRLGIRIPTIVISPWIGKGVVYNGGEPSDHEFDHTSLIKTTNEIFGVTDDFTDRVTWAKSFNGLIGDVMRDDTPLKLPEVYGLLDAEGVRKEIDAQKAKEINEHLEANIFMFCKLHYFEEFVEGEICENGKIAAINQDNASRWITKEQAKFLESKGRTRGGLKKKKGESAVA